ncbi:hypothetical protein BJ912DRAFT_1058820 [Pholiota molesta]|nr:hypothetical protein BJ912DRAFT_1058820 [Pholiota molesta]
MSVNDHFVLLRPFMVHLYNIFFQESTKPLDTQILRQICEKLALHCEQSPSDIGQVAEFSRFCYSFSRCLERTPQKDRPENYSNALWFLDAAENDYDLSFKPTDTLPWRFNPTVGTTFAPKSHQRPEAMPVIKQDSSVPAPQATPTKWKTPFRQLGRYELSDDGQLTPVKLRHLGVVDLCADEASESDSDCSTDSSEDVGRRSIAGPSPMIHAYSQLLTTPAACVILK